jgi:hypothetical protein
LLDSVRYAVDLEQLRVAFSLRVVGCTPLFSLFAFPRLLDLLLLQQQWRPILAFSFCVNVATDGMAVSEQAF